MKDLQLAGRVSLIYLMVGAAWILVSDWLSFASTTLSSAYWVETLKGLAFVLVTAVLLFWLVRKNTRLLCESEERLRLLVEGAPDAVLVEARGRVVYVNATMLRLVGVTDRTDIAGREISELIQGAALKAIRQRLAQVEQLKLAVNSQEVSFQRSDGKTVLCEVSAVPVKYDGEDGALLFIRDTTERAKCRERFESASKMETVKALAGSLAHDLNNLLQSINGYSDLACEALPEGGECRGYLEQVRVSGQRASVLVGKLLAFSKSKDPDKTESDLRELSAVATGGTQRLDIRAVLSSLDPAKARSQEAVRAARYKKRAAGRGGNAVLIAEDDEMVRALSAKILKRDGYAVIEAADGDTAVRLFQEHARDITAVILDVVMPHLDGFQAHDQIRALDSSVPILFASGYSGIETPSHVVLEPGVNLLQKPFDANMLLSAVRRAAG